MNESDKQFSFTRAALSTCGRAKSKFLSALRACCGWSAIQPRSGEKRRRAIAKTRWQENGLVAGAGGVTVAPAMKMLSAKAKISGLTRGAE